MGGFGGAVGGAPGDVPGQDVVFPAVHGAGEAFGLGDVGGVGGGVEGLQGAVGGVEPAGAVDGAQGFFDVPGGGDVPAGVAGGQTGLQTGAPPPARGVRWRSAGAADAIQRVVFAAAVAERFLLDAAADFVDDGVGQLDGVEVIDHEHGVGQPGLDGVDIAPVRVDGDHADVVAPALAASGQPARHRCGGAVFDDIQQPAGGHVDQPGDIHGVMGLVGAQEHRLVEPERGDRTGAGGSSTRGAP